LYNILIANPPSYCFTDADRVIYKIDIVPRQSYKLPYSHTAIS